MLMVVLLLIALTLTGRCHCHGHSHSDIPPLPELHQNQVASTSFSSSFPFPARRDVPEALIDPYSVLGVLSFGVYIFYILYNRYRMGMGNQPSSMGGGGTGGGSNSMGNGDFAPPPSAANLLHVASEQNLAYLLDVASKILSNAAKAGEDSFTNGTMLETLDYYEDNSDLQAS